MNDRFTPVLVTAPAAEPLTLAEAKLHLKLDVTADDDLITSLIVAARQHVETVTGRALVTQTWDIKYDEFPRELDAPIMLPKPPIASVTSVKYLDAAGVEQTWSSANYITDLPSGAWAGFGRIRPGMSTAYPATYAVINAVTVRIVCGYGAAAAVPDGLKAAMKILIGHWYVNRGDSDAEPPAAVVALLGGFRVWAC